MDDPKTPTGRRHSNSKKRRRSPNGETTVGNPTPRTSLAPRTTSPRPPVPPRYGRADANREIFLERERKAGQTFHHANLRHTVGKGASMFFSMFEETVQKATLDVDEDVVVEEEREKGLFRLDMVKSIAPKPKRQRSLPQHRGTHTLFLNRQLSGVQPPKTLTPRTRSKATSLSLMGVDTSMATDSVKVVSDKRARCSLNLRCTGHRATRRTTLSTMSWPLTPFWRTMCSKI